MGSNRHVGLVTTHTNTSVMPPSTYSNDSLNQEKKAAQRTSITLFYACVTAFGAAVLWLISFSSPYWLASWEDTRTDQRFLNMGLWTFCFDKFRFPRNQYDRMYHGCHPIWGYEYREIREWMAPWWLMLIQFFSALAFLLMNIALIVDVALYLRWPMEYVLRFEFNLVLFDFVLKTVVTCLIFFCLAMFGGWCWDREWLLYPNYNYPSWSYGVAVFAMIANGVAAFFTYMEAMEAKERKEKNQNLLMMMYPTAGFGGGLQGSLSTYHGSQFI